MPQRRTRESPAMPKRRTRESPAMPKRRTGPSLFLAILALGWVWATPLLADDGSTQPNNLGKMADLLILRPLGLVASAMGVVAYVVTMPLMERESGTLGNADDAKEMFINRPLRYTFSRPLGRLENQE
ncbi:MAG: hypothetical protein HQL63_11575 [Magnetococcales bacterium]|nr:hypothetical protein [Magnetococcales bacterium]